MAEKQIEQNFKADFRELFLNLRVSLLSLSPQGYPVQYSDGIISRAESSSKV
jgi:hypothetical protein